MSIIELKNLIASKLGIHASSIHVENFKSFAVRFTYHGHTYRVTTDLNVEKVDGACLVTDSDARQLENCCAANSGTVPVCRQLVLSVKWWTKTIITSGIVVKF